MHDASGATLRRTKIGRRKSRPGGTYGEPGPVSTDSESLRQSPSRVLLFSLASEPSPGYCCLPISRRSQYRSSLSVTNRRGCLSADSRSLGREQGGSRQRKCSRGRAGEVGLGSGKRIGKEKEGEEEETAIDLGRDKPTKFPGTRSEYVRRKDLTKPDSCPEKLFHGSASNPPAAVQCTSRPRLPEKSKLFSLLYFISESFLS